MKERLLRWSILSLAVMIIMVMGFGSTISAFATASGSADSGGKKESTEEENQIDGKLLSGNAQYRAMGLAMDSYFITSHLNKKYVSKVNRDAFSDPIAYARASAAYSVKGGEELTEGKQGSNILAGINYAIAIYDVDPDSRYYVAAANAARGEMEPFATDIIYNNDNGEIIDRAFAEDSIVYIPKNLMDSPKNKADLFDEEAPVAIQTSYVLGKGTDYSKKIPVIVAGTKGNDVTATDITVPNMFETYLRIPVAEEGASYEASDFLVAINGNAIPLQSNQYSYDKDSGSIVVHSSPATTSSVIVLIEKKSIAKRILNAISEDVYAIAGKDVAALQNSSGKEIVLFDSSNDIYDNMYIGWRGYYGKDDVGGDVTCHYNATESELESEPFYKTSKNYVYAGSTKDAAWALISYTRGRNVNADPKRGDHNDGNSADYGEDLKAGENIEYEYEYGQNAGITKKQKIGEWFTEFKNSIIGVKSGNAILDREDKHDYIYSKKDDGTKNHSQGAFTFAFKMPKAFHGLDSLLDTEANKQSFSFVAENMDEEEAWLAAWCRHYGNKVSSGGDQDKSGRMYVTCLNKTKEDGKCYVILAFTYAAAVGGEAQTPGAIYKFQVKPAKGWLKVKKSSSFSAGTEGNNAYSLKGATYGVYQGSTLIETLTTKENGETEAVEVPIGSYTVKETGASLGYNIDTESHNVSVTSDNNTQGNAAVVNSKEIPKTGFVCFYKTQKKANGSETLVEEGAEFQIWNTRYSSYEQALGADSKGRLAQTMKQLNGEVSVSGGLMDGTYKVKQISAGKQKDVSRLVPEFTLEVKADHWTGFYNADGDTPAARGYGTKQEAETELKALGVTDPMDQPYLFDLNIEKLTDDYILNHFDTNSLNSEEVTFKVESEADEDTLPGYSVEKSTDANGKVTFENLEAGTYRITETRAATGYYLPAEIAEATIVIGILGDISVVDQISHDGSGIIDIRENKETSDKIKKTLTWARKNTPQNTTLKISKSRKYKNSLGGETSEPQPRVEFNLYARGDIQSYDGHADHTYYKDGQLIQGILIDKDTGKRTYYVDGKETGGTKYRIITDKNGQWNSEGTDWKYYALTNEDSSYEMVEQFVWTTGKHVEFTEKGKQALTGFVEQNGKSLEDEIAEGMTFSQMLVCGIDVTGKNVNDDGNNDKVTGYSTNGTYIKKEYVKFINDNIMKYARGTKIIKDDVGEPVELAVIQENVDVIDPSEAADMVSETFQVLPFGAEKLTTEHVSTFVDDQTPKIGTSASLAKGNVIPDKGKVAIIDTVNYRNLTPGVKYYLKASLFDKKTGKSVTDEAGSLIEARSETFSPTSKNGTTTVKFQTIDAGNISGDVVVFERLYLVDGDQLVATHEDQNDEAQTIPANPKRPEIGTTATDKATGTHQGELSKTQTIVDTVRYTGLTPGKKYVLTGTLMDKSTGKPLVVEGGEITKTKTFVPKTANGKETLEYTIDSTALAGKTVVVFENVRPEKGDIIARHEIITDPDQSIYYVKIRTTATAGGKHSAKAKGTVTIEDAVEYWNLVPGKKYTVSGILMDKATGKPLRISGKEVKSTRTFTADKPHGTVTLSFRVKASKLNKKSVVVFERVYTANGTLIGSHEDLNDKGQTVSFKKKVGKVVIEGHGSTGGKAGAPDTGDATSILLFVVIALVSGGTLATLLMRKRFGKKEE